MTFLNPFVLIGLVAAGIPIAIHLLGKRRPRKVRFSAMAFLEEMRRQQFRRLRLRNVLLLLLRTLMIVLLVLAFARPAVRATLRAFGQRGESVVAVVLDDGPSMGYEGAAGRRLDWSRRQLSDLATLVGVNDWAVLLRTSRPDLVLPLNAETVENLKDVSYWSGDGMAALRHAAELLGRTDAANRELFVVTDLAGPPWANLKKLSWPARVAPYLIVPEKERTLNLSVDSLSTGGELIRAGRPLEIQAVLRNTGDAEVKDATIALWINDRRSQQKSVTVPAGGRLIAAFSTTLGATGWVTGRVEVSDDPLMQDNNRWFALFVPPETRLLVVGEDTPARRNLVSIFSSREMNAPYVPVAASPANITQQAVERADVIILNEQMSLDERALGWVRDALRRGAGLLVIVGPETDLQNANRRILPLVTTEQFTGLRSTLGSDSVAYFGLDRRRAVNPLVADLFVPGPSSQPRFADYVLMRSSQEATLASFTTGDPWAVMGAGRVGRGAILTSGLNPAWSDLALRGMVVPLLHRLVNHLARPVSLVPEYAPGPGGRRSLLQAGSRMELESPDGIRRALLPIGERTTTLVDLGMLTPPGCWRIWADERVADVFTVNLSPAESELRPMSLRAFQDATGLPPITRLGANPAARVAEARHGTELEIVLLLAALACLVAEMVVMRGIVTPSGEEE